MPASLPTVRIALLVGVFFSRAASISLLAPSIPAISQALGVTYGGAGSLITFLFAGYTIAVLVGGPLADRVGRRPILLAGAALNAASTLAVAFMTDVPAARVVAFGLGAAGVGDLTATVLLAEAGGVRNAGLLSVAHGAFALGSVLVPLAAGALYDAGVTYPVAFAGVATLNASLLVAIAAARGLGNGRSPVRPTGPDGHPARSVALYLGLATAFVYMAFESGLSVWLPTYMRDRHDASDTVASSAVAGLWAAMMVGRFALARVASRVDRRWLTGGFAAAAGALVAAGLLLDRMPATWACHVAAGLFLSVQVPVFQSLLTSAFPGSAGTVLGLLGVATGLSGAVSPWLVGSLADAFGGAGTGIATAFWVLPAAAAALAVVAPALAIACSGKSSGSISRP